MIHHCAQIVYEVRCAIMAKFQYEVLKTPANDEEWKAVAKMEFASLPGSLGWEALHVYPTTSLQQL